MIYVKKRNGQYIIDAPLIESRVVMKDEGGAVLGIFFVVLFFIFIFFAGPFIVIWALNGLFGLAIASSWTNWFYVAVLLFFIRGGSSSNNKD